MKISLKNICSFQSGGTPSKQNSDYFNGNIPWITTVALNGRIIDQNSAVDWITEKAIQESAAKIVPAGSIMVGTRVGVGKVAINAVPMSTSQDIISLVGIDGSKWNKEYLCKFLQSKESFLKSQSRGATIKGIKIDALAALEVPGLPLSEQEKIVSVLNHTLDIIEQRKAQLAALDELVKARFVEMFGDPIFNSKGLPTKKLGEICDLKSGDFTSADEIHDFKDDENPYPCYGGNGIRGYVNNYTHDGDFPIIGRQGALCGNVQYATGKFRNTEHAVLVTPINEINKIWLFELLTLENLYRFHTGAAQPGLAVKTLNTIDIPIADLKMQNAYSEFYKRIEKTKSTIEKALEQSQLLFDSLMQEYFG